MHNLPWQICGALCTSSRMKVRGDWIRDMYLIYSPLTKHTNEKRVADEGDAFFVNLKVVL